MYNLTYDSQEETESTRKSPMEPTPINLPEKHEATSSYGGVLSPTKRTQDRLKIKRDSTKKFYSLFANDAFLQQQPDSKKSNGCNIKVFTIIFFVVTISAGIVGFFILGKRLYGKIYDLETRIEVLEKAFISSGTGLNSPEVSRVEALIQRPENKISEQIWEDISNENKIQRLTSDLQAESSKNDAKIADVIRKLDEVSMVIKMLKITSSTSMDKLKIDLQHVKMISLLGLDHDSEWIQESLRKNLQYKGFHASYAYTLGEMDSFYTTPNGIEMYNINSVRTLLFRKKIDQQNLFDSSSGTFVVLSPGKYLIMLQFCTKTSKNSEIELIVAKNDDDLQVINTNNTTLESVKNRINHYKHLFITNLLEGDSIYIYISKSSILEYRKNLESCTKFSVIET